MAAVRTREDAGRTALAAAMRAALCTALAFVLLPSTATDIAIDGRQRGLPDRIEQYLDQTGALSADDRRRLLAGQPVTALLRADASAEVAVLGAVWIAAPAHRYVEAVNDIETFERGGGFRKTKKISTPPLLSDFDELRLTDEDIRDLRSCRIGNCEVKLSAEALQRFRREIDWRSPDAPAAANALMRQIAFEYVTRYLQGGNEQLAVYRDSGRPTFVAQEFRSMVEGMPELTAQMPNLRRYLLEYPAVALPDSTSFLYWQETEFGLKPTIRISHLTIRERAEDTVVASKMIYASHYFWTGLEIRALVPDRARGTGFWFITVSRSRSDGFGGFKGIFVRRRVRSEVQQGTLAALKTTKARLEQRQ